MAQLPHISRHPSTNLTPQPAEQSTFTKQNFVLIIKPFPALRHLCASQTWQFSRLRGVGSAFVLIIKPLPDLLQWFGIVWKQARFWGRISASGKKMRHRCGIFWLGWLMDVGRYEGVAPSMWAFAA